MTDFREYLNKLLFDLTEADTELILLTVLLSATAIVIDAVTTFVRRGRSESGLSTDASAVSIDGAEHTKPREYVSIRQGLAGRPDAIVVERGSMIPIERKPFARKIRDRYVAQLLVYMRLIEEFEGKRPPYGYLVLGPNCRQVRIDNTPQRQQWLQRYLDQMQAILHGAKAHPAPHAEKCRRCDVRSHCQFAWKDGPIVSIGEHARSTSNTKEQKTPKIGRVRNG